MKLGIFLLLSLAALAVDAYVVVPFTQRSNGLAVSTCPAADTTTALFDSRKRQKIARRSQWIETRAPGSSGTNTADATDTTGLQTNSDGLEYVQLVHPESKSSSQVYLYGGVVTSYVVDGHDFIAIRPDSKMDGSKPISGGMSHCWPQFGPGSIQQHGFARNMPWTVKDQTDTSVVLELAPSDYSKGIWDKNFLVTYTVKLEADQLSTEMIVDNKGDESFDFTGAIHTYFSVSELKNLEITGSFAGKEFLNKLVNEMQTEDRDVITINEEYDRVYKNVNDPVVKDSGTGKSIAVVTSAGWEDTVVWNPYGNEGMGYNNFVCVESVKFDPVTVDAKGSWKGVMALKPN